MRETPRPQPRVNQNYNRYGHCPCHACSPQHRLPVRRSHGRGRVVTCFRPGFPGRCSADAAQRRHGAGRTRPHPAGQRRRCRAAADRRGWRSPARGPPSGHAGSATYRPESRGRGSRRPRRQPAGASHHPSAGADRRAQSAAVELRRHHRAKGLRGPAIPLGLLRRTDGPSEQARDRAPHQQAAARREHRRLRTRLPRRRQFQAYQRLLRPCRRRFAAGRDIAPDRNQPARLGHAVPDQRRRIRAVALSGAGRGRGRRIHPLHAGADQGAAVYRRLGDLRFDLGRHQPISPARPRLRHVAPQCRYRDVSGEE